MSLNDIKVREQEIEIINRDLSMLQTLSPEWRNKNRDLEMELKAKQGRLLVEIEVIKYNTDRILNGDYLSN